MSAAGRGATRVRAQRAKRSRATPFPRARPVAFIAAPMARKLSIDWYYHRVGCTACRKAQEFLAGFELDVRVRVDARRTRIGPSALSKVVDGARTVLVSNGRSVARYDVAPGSRERGEMYARMVGPTGNLRAPTLKRGDLVVVGYHADSLKELVR